MTPEQLKKYKELVAQLPYPTKDIEKFLEPKGIINASTKPGYDPLHTLPELKTMTQEDFFRK